MVYMTKAIMILTTVGSEEQALTIAEELMQQELVACVNIMPTMRSIYRYKGKVFDDEENMLIIKTTANLYSEVCSIISQMHTYEVPEIVGFEIDHCEPGFLQWMSSEIKQPLESLSDRLEN
jgi:periplasmic divalent cation tolerance protein